jgi:hypothetical protein
MRQRAASIGAEFTVHSNAEGTRVQLRLPPAPAAQAEWTMPDWQAAEKPPASPARDGRDDEASA